MHPVLHFFGLDSASGPAYLAWSGMGSDVSELAIVGAMLGLLRKHNCEVRGCWRIGRHRTAAGHSVCRHHMPGGAPTHDEVAEAHQRAANAQPGA